MGDLFEFLSRRKKPLIFAFILTYLYFRGIGDHGLLDPVEGVNSSVSLHMLASGNYFVPRIGESAVAGRSMGSWWLTALSLRVFGWWEFAARFWSALGGLGIALSAALTSRRRPWLAASVAASMTLGFAVSQLASSHALYACFTGLAMAAFLRIHMILYYEINDSEWYGRWKWLLMAHVMPVAAFIVHGPEGILLPWVALLAFSVFTQRFSTFAECWTWWPGVLISLFVPAGYLSLLWLRNPALLNFMLSETPKLLEPDWRLIALLLAVGATPWQGFLAAAAKDAAAETMKALHSGTEEADMRGPFMMFYALIFGVAALVTGDILALSACVPALSASVGWALEDWMERDRTVIVQNAAAAGLLILLPLILIGIPLSRTAFPILGETLMSLIPWGTFVLLFAFVARRFAKGGGLTGRTRYVRLYRSTAAVALLCLMPLAGAVDLAADKMSLHDVGPALRSEIKPHDVIAQYAVNRPSLYFYTLHSSALVNGTLLPGVASKNLLMDDAALRLLWAGGDRVFLLMTLEQRPLSPLPLDVYNFVEANGVVVLSNR